jgi:sulfur-oxidizing protein SoxZ
MARAVVTVPPTAKRGAIIEIRTLAGHPMESGFRHDSFGRPIPRNIVTQFVCTYNGAEIFRADFSPAISANPLLTFTTLATESGTLEFKWTGDNDFVLSATAAITVE